MGISLVARPPQGVRDVLEVVAVVGVLKNGIFSEPDFVMVMTAC